MAVNWLISWFIVIGVLTYISTYGVIIMFTLIYQTEDTFTIFDVVSADSIDDDDNLLDNTIVLGWFPTEDAAWSAFDRAWEAYVDGSPEHEDGTMKPYPSF